MNEVPIQSNKFPMVLLNRVAYFRMVISIKKRTIAVVVSTFIILVSVSLIFSSCSQTDVQKVKAAKNDTILPPLITILSGLPENKKPKVIFLANVPPRNTISTSGMAIVSKNGAGLQNQTQSFINVYTKMPVSPDAQGKGFFTTYNTDNGLALDQLYCCYKDRIGNLWFGTNGGGVSRYDGKDFTNYTTAQGLANNIIWCINEDKEGNLWFGTDGSGVSKFDGEKFTTYTTREGLPGNVIYTILEDNAGNLWFGSLNGGVSRYDGKQFTNYSTADGLANSAVKCMLQDRTGNFWFGTFGGGVSKFDGKTFTNFSVENGLADNAIWSIAEDTIGNLWFGTGSKGVSKFDGKLFYNYDLRDGLADSVVLSIANDKQGNIWFGTLKGGVSKYDGKNFENYSVSQGLANDQVRSIDEDDKGNIWFSTFGGGISKYAGNSFTNFTRAQGLSNSVVYSIAQDSADNLWFATNGGGVIKYNGRSFTNFNRSQGLADNSVYCVANDKKGNLWFGTSGKGVSKFDGKSFINYTTKQGLANDVVFCICEDNDGNIWFATSGGGVSKFDGKSFTNYTTAQGLANNVVFTITKDKSGNLWFGTLGGGVSKYDGESFTNFTTAQGLANNVVWAITQDKNDNIWFGTQQGLSLLRKEIADQMKGNKNSNSYDHIFESYSTADGLPDNFITQIVQGNDNKLYIGTNLGFCELVSSTATKDHNKKWVVGKIFNSQTGYPVKDVNAGLGAMFKDRKGIIWIGTGSDKTGIVRFDPKALIDYTHVAPTIVIEDIKINNETICWSDLDPQVINEKLDSNSTAPIITDEVNTFGRVLSVTERDSIQHRFGTISFDSISKWYPIPRKLVLPYYFNNIGFDFNSIETGKNFLVKYQFMLNGYDKDWSPAGDKTSVNFGNISEGNYTFMLRAQSPEGVWSAPVLYSFKVLPPWYRTWWMYLVYAILFVAILLLFFRWNTSRIISQKKILEHKVIVATKQMQEENEKVKAQKKKIEETLKELEAAQDQLIQSEKMASLGELTAGIAHEIQNPLNFVNNFSEVNSELIDELKTEAQAGNTEEVIAIANDIKSNEEKIGHHGKRADAIVKGMLEHSRLSTGVKEPTNIIALADEYFRLAYHGLRAKNKDFNAEIKTDFDKTVEKVNIIPQEIGRVLLNLFNNAFYAVYEKAKSQPSGYSPTVLLTIKKIDDKVELTVRDNGNGISQKILDKIFQPFFTTKPSGEGTGLGLSLSYDIV
nr:ATP-binding protein [Bacteroidota bacterium]